MEEAAERRVTCQYCGADFSELGATELSDHEVAHTTAEEVVGYDHVQYLEDLRDAQAYMTDGIDRALGLGLDPIVDKIVRRHELCDMDSPRDGLYWATYNLVMIRLLQQQIAVYSRSE